MLACWYLWSPMIEFVFNAYFVFVCVKSLIKVHSQLCSILLGLGQPTSHMWDIDNLSILKLNASALDRNSEMRDPYLVSFIFCDGSRHSTNFRRVHVLHVTHYCHNLHTYCDIKVITYNLSEKTSLETRRRCLLRILMVSHFISQNGIAKS